MKKTAIGIIGGISSGKDLAADYIARHLSVSRFEISQPVKIIAQERGLALTRENLVELGTKLAREKGSAYLAEILLNKIENHGIITGMRQLGQIDFLKKNSKLILIALEAKVDLRFQRTVARGKQGEATTLLEFINKEQNENSGSHDQRLFECMKLADYTVNNDSDIDNLFKQLDDILRREKLV
jgi:dephospho-CoA kinase